MGACVLRQVCIHPCVCKNECVVICACAKIQLGKIRLMKFQSVRRIPLCSCGNQYKQLMLFETKFET